MVDFMFLFAGPNRDIAGRVALLLWHLWAAHNDFVWNYNCQTAAGIGKAELNMSSICI